MGDIEESLTVIDEKNFAKGYYNFYKIFLMFMFGCFIGDVYEIVLHFVRYGEWVQRRGVIYGPFNPVYGFALALMVLFLGKIKKSGKLFICGSILGGTFEYLCSYIQEKVFGSLSWDYSDLFLNINGRTTVPFALFWGFLCLVVMKLVVPYLSSLIEMIPRKFGIVCTWALCIFMIFDMGISTLAANRDLERHKNIPPKNSLDVFLDIHYPDEVMRDAFQNADFVDDKSNKNTNEDNKKDDDGEEIVEKPSLKIF
ncbi:putative uncharacterized protein [Clostridium sp. CAG:921]|nr:putative uncharacterized protein [Clostridium sp. CAG:921]